MVALKKFDIHGKELSEVAVEDSSLEFFANSQLVKDYIVAILANRRQWSANTKNRSEVVCTKKKPYAQKGTGRARQGFLAAPQYRGGGRVFGPKPKPGLERIRMNQREKNAVICSLLVDKVLAEQVCVLKASKMEVPKTKIIRNFIEKAGLSNKSVLFLYEKSSSSEEAEALAHAYFNMKLSLRNLPGVQMIPLANVNGYDIAGHESVVILEQAEAEFFDLLKGEE